MGWREWPAWLKGGVIGLILLILAFIVSVSCVSLVVGPNQLSCVIPALPILIGGILAELLGFQNKLVVYFIMDSVDLILYFSIGAFIGWIVGKLKNRNQ